MRAVERGGIQAGRPGRPGSWPRFIIFVEKFQMSRRKPARAALWSAGVGFLLAALVAGAGEAGAQEYYSGWWLPVNIASEYGQLQDFMFNIFLAITSVLALIFYALMIYAFVFNRARKGRKAYYTHGSRKFHIGLVVFFTVFVLGGEVFVLGQITGDMWERVKQGIPGKALRIEVLAEQFAWNIRYPGPDGKFGKTDRELMDEENAFGLDEDDSAADDDIVTIGRLHIPVNVPIHVLLRSKDVLHSFFIPVLRVKQDAVPGETINVWMRAVKTGKFQLVCAELCGLGHTTMKGSVVVESKEDFQAWLEKEAEED